MGFTGKEFAALALIAIMMLSPLAAAVLNAENPKLQNKARTDLITPAPEQGVPPAPGATKP